MDFDTIVKLGTDGVVIFLLLRTLTRLDTITDRIFSYLESDRADRNRAEAQRVALMKNQGIDPDDSGIYRREDVGLPARPS